MPRTTRKKSASAISLDDPSLYVNRELSLLEFQRRVLEEAKDTTNPLLERVKFLSILGSNLDEFFMVRVAGLLSQLESGALDTGPEKMSPAQQLEAIRSVYEELLVEAHECLRKLFAELEQEGISVREYDQLTDEQKEIASRYFEDSLFPVLTPLAVDPGRPFPHISNLSLNLSVLIRDADDEERFARVKVPPSLPQLIPLQKPSRRRGNRAVTYIWIEQLIRAHLANLFPGMEVIESHLFHVTRDAEMAIQEIEADDLLETVEEGVRQRRFGSVVRLVVDEGMPDTLLDVLRTNFETDETELYRVNGPLALSRLKALLSIDRPDLKDHPFTPAPLPQAQEGEDIFTTIRRGDILVHHPYSSFQPVVDFLRAAARDPDVLAIKMTLYRVGRNSPVVEALLEANEEGKQVAVVVELKARFDEESNIEWARALEREGVHVVYGLVGLKVHAKVALVIRREGNVMRRYIHLSTGNYNAVTAHLYTDLGFFTANPEIGEDATHLFNALTGYSAKSDYRQLLVAPTNLRKRIEEMITRETAHATAGREARIVIKCNSFVDQRIIKLLYTASRAGVQVDLLARGICCLRPGLKGVSENIHVTSIVGRFLEHSRIFYFLNGGEEEVYLGSADMMPRNINRRVEVLFPVTKPALMRQIRDRILAVYLQDNVKARRMNADGTYSRVKPKKGERVVNSQLALLRVKR
ncbi:MAG: polyphosphate kinase 1 [Bryobacteraceae bacterium]|nr:polyphosphate kinase 1 [Bryobacteraceae bacterium]